MPTDEHPEARFDAARRIVFWPAARQGLHSGLSAGVSDKWLE
jgi:hypothetical protein